MASIVVDSRTIELSNLDKVLFPDAGLTKGDLVHYYRRISNTMLPYLRNRPLNMHRFPDGIQGEGFFQQHASDYFPPWIERVRVSRKEDGTVEHVVCQDAATLVYLANQACITPHVWLSRIDALDRPDRLVFDLDPPTSDFEPVRAAARHLRSFLEELELPAFVMTTGSRGLHVLIPLDRSEGFDAVRSFARDLATALARRHPQQLTVEQRKAQRNDRVFLDYLRNSYGQTAVAPYSVRARPGAPVATPLEWHELAHRSLGPQSYTLRNIFRRLGQKADPWRDLSDCSISLTAARKRLGKAHWG